VLARRVRVILLERKSHVHHALAHSNLKSVGALKSGTPSFSVLREAVVQLSAHAAAFKEARKRLRGSGNIWLTYEALCQHGGYNAAMILSFAVYGSAKLSRTSVSYHGNVVRDSRYAGWSFTASNSSKHDHSNQLPPQLAEWAVRDRHAQPCDLNLTCRYANVTIL
jgi:hypothetical protein